LGQIAADVFNADVLVADVPDAAAVGAARRAAFALACSQRQVPILKNSESLIVTNSE